MSLLLQGLLASQPGSDLVQRDRPHRKHFKKNSQVLGGSKPHLVLIFWLDLRAVLMLKFSSSFQSLCLSICFLFVQCCYQENETQRKLYTWGFISYKYYKRKDRAPLLMFLYCFQSLWETEPQNNLGTWALSPPESLSWVSVYQKRRLSPSSLVSPGSNFLNSFFTYNLLL